MSVSAAEPASAARPKRRLSWAVVLPLGWVALVVFAAIAADWLGLPDPAAQDHIMLRRGTLRGVESEEAFEQ